jgi:hypothetical protein
MLCIDAPWLINMVNIEHDKAGRDSIGGLATAITREAACVWCDDRQLTFQTSKFLGILTIEELDLVADMLNAWVTHGGFNLVPDNGCWLASGYRTLNTNTWKHNKRDLEGLKKGLFISYSLRSRNPNYLNYSAATVYGWDSYFQMNMHYLNCGRQQRWFG